MSDTSASSPDQAAADQPDDAALQALQVALDRRDNGGGAAAGAADDK